MNHTIVVKLLLLVPVFLVFVLFVLIPRFRMKRRARALLAQYPDAVRTSVYLPFQSAWPNSKRKQMEAKISEMKADGWIFLRATEVNPLRTICSWGGGLTLHFIRPTVSHES
jgi:hypothetical protein